jgi:hypothetical protein
MVRQNENHNRSRRDNNGSADNLLEVLRYALGGLANNNFDEANFKAHQQAEDNASQASLHIGEIDAGGDARVVNVFSGSADVTIDRVDIGGDAQVINLFLDDETISRLRQIQPANHSTEVYPRYR